MKGAHGEPWRVSGTRALSGSWLVAVAAGDSHAQEVNRIGRIAACVNACDGIEDPAAALAEVRAILAAFHAWNEADHASTSDRPNYEALDHTIGRACRALSLLTPKV